MRILFAAFFMVFALLTTLAAQDQSGTGLDGVEIMVSIEMAGSNVKRAEFILKDGATVIIENAENITLAHNDLLPYLHHIVERREMEKRAIMNKDDHCRAGPVWKMRARDAEADAGRGRPPGRLVDPRIQGIARKTYYERRRLEESLQALEADPSLNSSRPKDKRAREYGDQARESVKQKMRELDEDPQYYFYKQGQKPVRAKAYTPYGPSVRTSK